MKIFKDNNNNKITKQEPMVKRRRFRIVKSLEDFQRQQQEKQQENQSVENIKMSIVEEDYQ